MKIKIGLLAAIALFFCTKSFAQIDSLFWNKEMAQIATPSSNSNWINIKPEISLQPAVFFATQKKALGLGAPDEFRLVKTERDEIGMTHYQYQQFYKGYKIDNGLFFLHEKEGRLATANGMMVKGLNKQSKPQISGTKALQNALVFLPATVYAWEIATLENDLKETMHDRNATYKPVGEIAWVSNDLNSTHPSTSSYELAFIFDIYPASMNGKRIMVSATDGHIIKSIPLSAQCDATSTLTNFYGSQGFSTRLIPGSSPARWNMWNDCQTGFIHTRQWVTDATSNEYISASGNNWTGVNSAATSHWATEKSYNYFLSIHGRAGWNNANAGVNVYHDALFCYTAGCTPNSPNNASMSFSGGVMKVGNSGNNFTIDDWNSLDIIAHEFTHAVTASSFASLIYQKESGALNESFSDIFGISCEAWLFGVNGNTWKFGFDRRDPTSGTSLWLRDMANPNNKNAATNTSFAQPDTYLGTNWISTTTPTDISGDNWGVHINSGVQNYMYYLLTSGGSGVNDNGTAYSLIGIGIVAARAIAYRALTIGYLFSNSGFSQARTAWVHAAVDLYGECSLQAIETGKAWNAVGLAPPENNSVINICGTFGASVFSITQPGIYSLSPNCNVLVTPSSLVQFGARKVILSPGFRANNGSRFRAYVSDCRFAAY